MLGSQLWQEHRGSFNYYISLPDHFEELSTQQHFPILGVVLIVSELPWQLAWADKDMFNLLLLQ